MFNLFKRKKGKIEVVNEDEPKGVIAEYYENDNAVILKYVDELPTKEIISKFNWFTVVSWKYDGSSRNGMPDRETNLRMIALEHALASAFDSSSLCRHAYNRTGNNLKEFNYYINNRDEFMEHFNVALKGHEAYPIEINFYKDSEWSELRKLIKETKR